MRREGEVDRRDDLKRRLLRRPQSQMTGSLPRRTFFGVGDGAFVGVEECRAPTE
jgi:hypothetical protein